MLDVCWSRMRRKDFYGRFHVISKLYGQFPAVVHDVHILVASYICVILIVFLIKNINHMTHAILTMIYCIFVMRIRLKLGSLDREIEG
mgnify:CR=1 FL=1